MKGTEMNTVLGTNIFPKNGILKMIFLFRRWDMLIPWRVYVFCNIWNLEVSIFFGWSMFPPRFLLKAVAKRAEGKAKARAKPEAKAKVSVESWANLDWICSKFNMFPHNILQRFMTIHAWIAQASNSQRRSFEFVGGVSHDIGCLTSTHWKYWWLVFAAT